MIIQKIRLIKLLGSQIIYKSHEDVYQGEGCEEEEESDNRIDEDVLRGLGLLIITCRRRVSDARPDDRTDGKKRTEREYPIGNLHNKIFYSLLSSTLWYCHGSRSISRFLRASDQKILSGSS